ncbi:tol, partial [Fusarium albosuccineum]
MSNPEPSSTMADGQEDTGNDLIKLLTKQDGTLCDFCHDALTNPPESGAPFLTRALSELVDASSYCGFCAMWVRALDQSAQDLGEAGQDVARKLHPLVQESVEPEDVLLQFVSLHDWERGSIEQRIAWPHMGPIWATLDLVKTDGLLAESDRDDSTWKTIRAWLAHCGSNHNFCKWKKDISWKPSRLIHINPSSDPLEIHLVEGADVPDRVEYLTLSHCWGGGSPLQLTKETLEPFKSSISADDLPRTFLDACNVVKLLGHKYLWIDSLCIIQDDPEDWAIQAGRMASVYGNAWLSICATAASDVHDGLFSVEEERDRKAWLPIWVRRAWGGPFSGDYCVSDFRSWWTRLANTPLNRRAWAFQERALAPRVLHLGLEQVAFECCSMCACERLPLRDPIRRQGPYSHNLSDVKDLILG